ncbi:MAG: hypothetical protein ACI4RJ_03920 [Alphaproteobacteria bacterium]
MEKYAKIINEETKECCVGIGTNTAFYKKIGMKLAKIHEEQDDEENTIYIWDEWLEEEQPVEEVKQEDEDLKINDEEQKNNPLSNY